MQIKSLVVARSALVRMWVSGPAQNHGPLPGCVTLGKSPKRITSPFFIDTMKALELWVFMIFSTENRAMILGNFNQIYGFLIQL